MAQTPRSAKSGRSRPSGGPGAAGLLLALAFGFDTPSALGRSPSCDAAQRFKLENGVEVVLLADATLPSVALVSSIHVGSRDDPPGQEGLAHYVEHLTFREAMPFASAFDLYDEAGATEVNAATSADTTDFYAVLPAVQLERAVWIEARRLAIGLDLLDEKSALDERRVLSREHALRNGYAPGYRLLEATLATLYPGRHPYHSLLATESSLADLTLADARAFFSRYYEPSRVRLVLVGDFHAESALRLIERDFAGRERAAVARAEKSAAELSCERWAARVPAPSSPRVVLRSRARDERLELYWPVLAGEQPERWRGLFRLLESELGSAARKLGLARGVQGQLVQRELASFWQLTIDAAPGQPLNELEPLVQSVVSALAGRFVDEPRLASERQALELEQALDASRLLGRARNLARRECTPSVCADAAAELVPTAAAEVGRFSPSRAMIVERRYAPSASDAGDVEAAP